MSLRINGIQLADASGRPFKFRGTFTGINATRYSKSSTPTNWMAASSPSDSLFDEAAFQRMKSYGANTIEMQAFGAGDFMPNGGVDLTNGVTQAYLQNWVDDYARWANKYQIYTIIDIGGWGMWGIPIPTWALPWFPNWLWQGLYPAPVTQADYEAIRRDWFDLAVTKQNANRQAFIDLWAVIAGRYGNPSSPLYSPYILFSPMNEPVVSPNSDYNSKIGQDYSTIMTQTYDAIRNAGATQPVFINRPYMNTSTWQLCLYPIDRDVIWEDHTYVASYRPTMEGSEGWLRSIDNMILMYQQGTSLPPPWASVPAEWTAFTSTHPKPIFIGEYGIDPPNLCRTTYTNWQDIFAQQTAYIDSKPIVGRQWYSWGDLFWKFENGITYYNSMALPPDQYDPNGYGPAFFTQAESELIESIVLGTPTEITLPFHDSFIALDPKWTKVNGVWSIQ